MTSLAAYSKRPYVSFTERMQEQALLRQKMQNEAEQRAYTQQKNALDLAQAEENLRQAQSGFGQNVPASVQQWNFYKNIRDPKEKELYLSTIKNSGGGYAQVNLGDQIGLLNKSTGQIEQTFPKGVLPRNYVNTLGDVSTIPGISSGYGQGQGQPQAMPQPPMQQGGMPYEPLDQTAGMQTPRSVQILVDNGLKVPQNAQGGVDLPAADALVKQYNLAQLMQPPAGGMQPSMPQTVLQPPVRNPDGTYTYGGLSYRNSTAAKGAYDFDLKKQETSGKALLEQDKDILKEYSQSYNDYTLKGPKAASNLVESLKSLNAQYDRLGYAESGVVGGRLPAFSSGAQRFDTTTAALQTKNNPFEGQGTISNFERELLARTIPSRSYRKETMQQSFEAAKALKTIQDEKQKFVANWKKTNGVWDAQGEIALKAYIEPIAEAEFYRLYPEEAGVLPTTQGAAQPMMPAGGNIIQTSHGPVTRSN